MVAYFYEKSDDFPKEYRKWFDTPFQKIPYQRLKKYTKLDLYEQKHM